MRLATHRGCTLGAKKMRLTFLHIIYVSASITCPRSNCYTCPHTSCHRHRKWDKISAPVVFSQTGKRFFLVVGHFARIFFYTDCNEDDEEKRRLLCAHLSNRSTRHENKHSFYQFTCDGFMPTGHGKCEPGMCATTALPWPWPWPWPWP